ncbi:hypothetical protein FACS1894201_00940 [Bacteroidia bacterium]|nr:hypothetical protein FACS1894201_00940 [Bacteroidia bacterium]
MRQGGYGEYKYLQEACLAGVAVGLSLKLANPYFIKQLPGRKSDVKDAQWIAECLQKELLAITRKILVIVFNVLNTGQPFDPNRNIQAFAA